MHKTFTKALIAAGLATSALAVTAPAEARPYYHGGRGGDVVVAGIAGLAVGAALASDHRRYYPREYYYRDYPVDYYYDDGPVYPYAYPVYYSGGYYPRSYYYRGGGWGRGGYGGYYGGRGGYYGGHGYGGRGGYGGHGGYAGHGGGGYGGGHGGGGHGGGHR